MEDHSYSTLQKMLRTNKEFYKNGSYPFAEYLENHRLIMQKIKSSIVKIEDNEFSIINIKIDNLKDFKSRLLLLKQSYN